MDPGETSCGGARRRGYLGILRTPGAAGVFGAAVVARLALAMVGLATIVLVAGTSGSYATAGVATGLFGLLNVVVAPWRARLVDRFGQRRGLRSLGLAYAATVALLTAAATTNAHPAVIFAAAALAGASAPPVGAAMRARWRMLVEPADVSRAYSLDAVSEEVVFTLGPPIAGLLMAVTVPQAGLLASGACALIGCFAMTRHVADAPSEPPRAVRDGPRPRLLRRAGFLPALVLMAAIGIVVGATEVIVPAQTAPHDLLAGLLLGALAAGSAIGGLVYGIREWRWSAAARLTGFATAMVASCLVLAVAAPLPLLAVCLGITGLALAPAIISGYLVADGIADDGSRLEAQTWVNAAMNAGAAAAAAVAGLVVDGTPAPAAYLLTAGVAGVFVVVGVGALWLARRRRDPAPDRPSGAG